MATLNDVWDAYEEGQGCWTGCDWPTHYGSLGLDLKGVSSGQARRTAGRWRAVAAAGVAEGEMNTGEEDALVEVAEHLRLRRAVVLRGEGQEWRPEVEGRRARRFCAEVLAREWGFVSGWLEEIEADARWAEEEAGQAVRAAEAGDWGHALGHARRACAIESGYNAPRPWRHFRRVLEAVVR